MFKKKPVEGRKITQEEIERKLRETPLEKGDLLAMMIAGFAAILPLVLMVLGVFVVVIWLLFLR